VWQSGRCPVPGPLPTAAAGRGRLGAGPVAVGVSGRAGAGGTPQARSCHLRRRTESRRAAASARPVQRPRCFPDRSPCLCLSRRLPFTARGRAPGAPAHCATLRVECVPSGEPVPTDGADRVRRSRP
jgi:hypothetical protein